MPITLTTDFGAGHYVAQVKGVVLGIHPDAVVVDIAHDVRPQNVREGAFVLFAAAPAFPPDTVHVGVVDPGVGTARRGLALETGAGLFVGPDNGILVPAARRFGVERAVELTQGKYWRDIVSGTFHGRDVFAPVAAHLDAGHCDLDDLGEDVPIEGLVPLDFGTPWIERGAWRTRIVHIDRFGNAVTNLPGAEVASQADFGAVAQIQIDDETEEAGLHATYGTAHDGELLVTPGSSGFLELAVNKGSAAERLRLELDQEILVRFVEP